MASAEGIQAVSRQERRKFTTRSQLLHAARALIIEKGVAALRIGEITDRADVGRGSFYNHFETKDDLLTAMAKEAIEELGDGVLAELPADEDPAVLASIADRRFIRLASSDRDLARLLVNLDQGDDLFTAAAAPYAAAVIEAGIASGRFHLAEPAVFYAMLAGSALALIRAILAGTAPDDADQAHAEATLRMLGVPGDEAGEISRRPLPDGVGSDRERSLSGRLGAQVP
jgi:AcrR family transcriptional regulator